MTAGGNNNNRHLLFYPQVGGNPCNELTFSENVYLDNAPEDPATSVFFLHQGIEPPEYTRRFMGETYGIIAGVETGLGKSVMPVNLLAGRPHLRKSKSSRNINPITLHYRKKSYYSDLHKAVVKQLSGNCSKYLNPEIAIKTLGS